MHLKKLSSNNRDNIVHALVRLDTQEIRNQSPLQSMLFTGPMRPVKLQNMGRSSPTRESLFVVLQILVWECNFWPRWKAKISEIVGDVYHIDYTQGFAVYCGGYINISFGFRQC